MPRCISPVASTPQMNLEKLWSEDIFLERECHPLGLLGNVEVGITDLPSSLRKETTMFLELMSMPMYSVFILLTSQVRIF